MSRRARWMAALLVALLVALFVVRWRGSPEEDKAAWETCEAPSAHVVREAKDVAAPASIELEEIATLSSPTAAVELGQDTYLVTLKESGIVQVDPQGDVTEVLDLTSDLSFETERGVLGLAVQPDGGAAFVAYTAGDGTFTVERFPLPIDGQVKDRETILSYPDDHRFHNGGHLAFGPDGMLYISLGDGGDEYYLGDPEDDAQDLGSLFGKILRIDVTTIPGEYRSPADNPFVDDPDARAEIWAYGFRNPWRFTFDADTGDLWVADVGHFCWEEIDVIPAGRAGANLGWNRYEGGYEFRPEAGAIHDPVWPVHQYRHVPGPAGAEVEGEHATCAIVGGGLYAGAVLADLDGWYVYSDYCSRVVYALSLDASGAPRVAVLADTPEPVISLATDEQGEVLVLTTDGLLRMVPSGGG